MHSSRFIPTPALAGLALLVAAIGATATASAQMSVAPAAPVSVSAAWLAANLKDPNLVLLHVGDSAEYARGHISGARHVKLDQISVSSHDGKGLVLEMPQPDSLRARLEAIGISDKSRVIVYYGNDWVSPATRVIFTLDYAGLGQSAALLDGGMPAWTAAGHALSRDAAPLKKGQLAALHVKPIIVDAAWVKSRLGTPGFHLVDGRDASFYDGVESGGPRKGHVAGARSIPYTEITDDKLFLRSPAELNALFAKAGIAPGDTVVAYCHIGQQATAVLFAARLVGHPVLLYDGSYQEWSRNPDLPVDDPRPNMRRAQ